MHYLDGKFYKSSSATVRNETGFIFPITFTAGSETQRFESVQETISLLQLSDNLRAREFDIPESDKEEFPEYSEK